MSSPGIDPRESREGSGVLTTLRSNLTAVLLGGGCLAALTAFMALTAGPEIGIGIGFGLGIAFIVTGAVVQRLWRGPFTEHMPIGQIVLSGAVGFVAVMLVAQVVPYGWDHSNPPVLAEPAWDSPRTRELTVAACYDCHSNEVAYPWYSRVAPFSWAVQFHVDEGRGALNFSEWGTRHQEADEAAESVIEGEMPPFYYTLIHSGARLTDSEKRQLVDGLTASLRSR